MALGVQDGALPGVADGRAGQPVARERRETLFLAQVAGAAAAHAQVPAACGDEGRDEDMRMRPASARLAHASRHWHQRRVAVSRLPEFLQCNRLPGNSLQPRGVAFLKDSVTWKGEHRAANLGGNGALKSIRALQENLPAVF